jgi:RNA-directed DNA polymerase
VDVGLLRSAYSWQKRDAAPGVDGMTWQEYGEELERKLAATARQRDKGRET